MFTQPAIAHALADEHIRELRTQAHLHRLAALARCCRPSRLRTSITVLLRCPAAALAGACLLPDCPAKLGGQA